MAQALRVVNCLLWLLLFAGVVHQVTSLPQDSNENINSHEEYRAHEPAPRDGHWMPVHYKYMQEVEDLAAAPELDILWLGDDITEHALGKCEGQPCHQHVAAVFKHAIQEKYKTRVFGLAGDQTPNLLWRVMNGELGDLKPNVVVILIGTNDLGVIDPCWREGNRVPECENAREEAADLLVAAQKAAATVAATVDYILKHSRSNSTQVLLQGVLPRGHAGVLDQPSKFTKAISMLNADLKTIASTRPRAHFVDCSSDFLSPEDESIVEAFMPDGVHPSPVGELFMLDCLLDPIQWLLQRPSRRRRHRRHGSPAAHQAHPPALE